MSAKLPELDCDPYDPVELCAPAGLQGQIRELAPVVAIPRYAAVAIARVDLVEQIYREWQHFTSARGVGLADFAREPPWRPPSIVLEVDPPAHERTRRVLAGALSPAVLNAWRPQLAALAADFVDAASAQGDIDGVRELAEAFPLRAFGDLVGIPSAGREHLLHYGRMVFDALGPDNSLRRDALAGAEQTLAWLSAACAPDALSPDGLGARVFAGVEQGLIDSHEATLLVRSLLSAGIDTTVATLAHLLHCFAADPGAWQQLRAASDGVAEALDEVLRFASPIHTFCRTSVVDAEIDGLIIPAGTKVLLMMAGANRDPRRWKDPEQFDPNRPRRPHVALGHGVHVCVGQHLARLEIRALVDALCHRVRSMELLSAPLIAPGNAVRGIARLPLRLFPG